MVYFIRGVKMKNERNGCMSFVDQRDSSCLVGRRVLTNYVGGDGHTYREGCIVEVMPKMRFGVTFDGYSAYGQPIVVDFRRGEFVLPKRVY
jgi:hypothetical protein